MKISKIKHTRWRQRQQTKAAVAKPADTQVVKPTTRRFSGSAILSQLYSKAPSERAEELIRELLKGYPGTIDDEMVKYLASNARNSHLNQMAETIKQVGLYRNGSPLKESNGLGDFFVVQCLVSLLENPFDTSAEFPPSVISLFEWGAEGLHTYARPQARRLAIVALKLQQWCVSEGHSEVIVVDSPLGGTLPAQVIATVLQDADIVAQVREFLAPRLEKSKEKHSIRRSAEAFVSSLPEGKFPVIYADEMLTGSRFNKLYAALYRHLGTRLVPVALETRNWAVTTEDAQTMFGKAKDVVERIRARVEDSVKPLVHFSFSPSTLLKIDSNGPVAINSPFFWGEVDFITGKRKVNFVFDLINHLRLVNDDFSSPASESIKILDRLWSRDVTGAIFGGEILLLTEILQRNAPRVGWDEILRLAVEKFPDEYVGGRPEFGPDFTTTRLGWILGAIRQQLDPERFGTGEPCEAGLLAYALQTMFDYTHSHKAQRPKNRDYCEYTIPYGLPIAAVNAQLVSLVMEEVRQQRERNPGMLMLTR